MNMDVMEQKQLFNNCSHFVSANGAHMANTIFMNSDCHVLDISETDGRNNSWQIRYGTHILDYKFTCATVNQDSGREYSIFRVNGEKDIIIDDSLKNTIILFLQACYSG